MGPHMPSTYNPSPLMRVVRTPLGRYELQIGLAKLDLGPGDIKKLSRLLSVAVDDFAQLMADDACGISSFERHLPPNPDNDPQNNNPQPPDDDPIDHQSDKDSDPKE